VRCSSATSKQLQFQSTTDQTASSENSLFPRYPIVVVVVVVVECSNKGKGKGQVGLLDIALLHDEHMLRSAIQSRKCMAADWHELVIPQRIIRPSVARAEQTVLETRRCSMQTYHRPNLVVIDQRRYEEERCRRYENNKKMKERVLLT